MFKIVGNGGKVWLIIRCSGRETNYLRLRIWVISFHRIGVVSPYAGEELFLVGRNNSAYFWNYSTNHVQFAYNRPHYCKHQISIMFHLTNQLLKMYHHKKVLVLDLTNLLTLILQEEKNEAKPKGYAH